MLQPRASAVWERGLKHIRRKEFPLLRSKDKPPESIARMARIYRAFNSAGPTEKDKISSMAEKHPATFTGFDDFIKLKARKSKATPATPKKKSTKKKRWEQPDRTDEAATE